MDKPQTPIPQRLLTTTVFIGGMTTLAVELAASRLLGKTFGVSHVVWANIIGLILIYLSTGYFVGGRWADRQPYPHVFFTIAAWGAFLSGLIPFVAQGVLPTVSEWGLPLGLAVAITVLTLFTVPITLLGCLSPFAIRLMLRDVNSAGQTAGRLYAISTLGSVLGSLIPVLFLLPAIGTRATFLIFADILLLVTLYGLAAQNWKRALWLSWMPLLHLILWTQI